MIKFIFYFIQIFQYDIIISNIITNRIFRKRFNPNPHLTEINASNVSEKILNWYRIIKILQKKEYLNFVIKYDQNKGGNTKGEIAVLNDIYIGGKKKFNEFTYGNGEIKIKSYQNLKSSNYCFFIDFLSEITGNDINIKLNEFVKKLVLILLKKN